LVHRHLALKMLDPAQIEHLDSLPERPPVPAAPPADPIANIIDALEPELPNGAPASPTPTAAGAPR
jgi:hypothetical protein